MSEATHEWRQVGLGQWWLVFSDAPEDFGRGSGKVEYPPMMTMSWSPNGCCHLNVYYNGHWPDEEDPNEDNCDYMHICDPRDLIADLQRWMETAKYTGESG